MIIGGNNNTNNNFNASNSKFVNNNFTQNNQFEERKINTNIFTKDLKEFEHTNPASNTDMDDKTLAMLHKRLKNNEITMDEFNKKCQQLGQKRQNSFNNKKNF